MKISVAEMQETLIRCLAILGCEEICVLTIMAQLWHPDDMMEMLMYIYDHREAKQEELYKVSSRISAKRGDPPEIDEEEDEYAD